MKEMIEWVKKNAPTILACTGAIGVVATAVLAAKATTEVEKRCRKREEEKGSEPPTTLEKVEEVAAAYSGTAAVAAATIVCILSANYLDRRTQGCLVAAYAALDSAFRKYRGQVGHICGPEADRVVQKAIVEEKRDAEEGHPPWDEPQTFYIDDGWSAPRFFERTMREVLQAEYHLNRNFILRGSVSLNEFFDFLGLPHLMEGGRVGWDSYTGETLYGYQWIDFEHEYRIQDDGMAICSIEMPFGPHPLDEVDAE